MEFSANTHCEALPDNPRLKNGRKIIAISGGHLMSGQIECNHNWMSNQLHFQDLKLCGMQFVLPLHKQVIFMFYNIAPKVFIIYLSKTGRDLSNKF